MALRQIIHIKVFGLIVSIICNVFIVHIEVGMVKKKECIFQCKMLH